MEEPGPGRGDPGDLSRYSLQSVLVTEDLALAGLSIRDSGLRERTGGLVVGLERGGERTVNPNPATILQLGDLLWVVGPQA